jgi:cobalt/nickel transport system ATP-binding protein
VPEVAFGNPEYVRSAHPFLPALRELHGNCKNAASFFREKNLATVLDMMQSIKTMFEKMYSCARSGIITIYYVDRHISESFSAWHSGQPVISVGTMGTRAKQRAENEQIQLDFTCGVIDKCILKALLGEDSLIMTTGNMVDRVYYRFDVSVKERGIPIVVKTLDGGS